MDEETLKLFNRLKHTQEGVEFIQFLTNLQQKTYLEFLSCMSVNNDIVKGKGLLLYELLETFTKCDDKLIKQSKKDIEWAV